MAKRISLSFAALLILIAFVGGISYYGVTRTAAGLQTIVTDPLPGVYEVGRMADCVGNLRALTLIHTISPTAEKKAVFRTEIVNAEKAFRQIAASYDRTITTTKDRELFVKIMPAFEAYISSVQRVLDRSDRLENQAAGDLYIAEARPLMIALMQAVNAEVSFNKTTADADAKSGMDRAAQAKRWIWIIALFAIFVGASSSIVVVKGVNKELHIVARELRAGAEHLASAATQVSSSSESLSQGTAEQAASLEETSATTEQINAMAQKNMEASRSVAGIVSESSQRFSETTTALDSTVQAMSGIAVSSEKIRRIIKVIDEIAFQTNILALNAAVEAARAGEAGMGFAVVADEVRNLAQRCAGAARETATLIEESIVNAGDGKAKVDQVAALVRALAGQSAHIQQLVDEVSAGSAEQARGIEQITRTVQQMQTVTQSSAATAEQSAAAAVQLAGQSGALRDVVGHLRALVGDAESDFGKQECTGKIDFDQAVEAHAAWKDKLTAYIRKPDGSINVATLAKDDQCALGKWIHNQKLECDSDPVFSELKQEHANFHRAAADIVKRANAGESVAAEVVLGGRSVYSQYSSRVVQLISRIKALASH